MYIINLTSSNTNSKKIESEESERDQINLGFIEDYSSPEFDSKDIKKYEPPSNQECASAILSESEYQISDNTSSFLGKKQKPKKKKFSTLPQKRQTILVNIMKITLTAILLIRIMKKRGKVKIICPSN